MCAFTHDLISSPLVSEGAIILYENNHKCFETNLAFQRYGVNLILISQVAERGNW